jgi:hypothetical protein
MRYYVNAEIQPVTLKQALEKVKGVQKVAFEGDRFARVTWAGKCKDLGALENAASASGVPAMVLSHCHLYIAFKPLKGANLETLQKSLEGLKGVKGARVSGAAAELHADLETLTIADLRAAAKEANVEAQLKSHQWIEAAVKSGDAARVEQDIAGLRGVLVVKSGSSGLGFWAIKAVTDAMLSRAAEKSGAELDAIVRP